MELRTLFILFYFPPFPRVGSRRWAKHIKYLHRLKHPLHVLAGAFNEVSPWDEDVKSYAAHTTRIPVRIYYPFFKQKLPASLLENIKWKLSYFYNSMLQSTYPGNFWDDSRGYEQKFLQHARRIIRRENINHVCLSVGPFSYATILPSLRHEFKDLKITLDFRDYWEDGFGALDAEKRRAEEKKLRGVLNSVDLVMTPNTEMSSHYAAFGKRTFCLPHCMDEEYLTQAINTPRQPGNTISFVYGGSLYEGTEKYIRTFLSFARVLQSRGFEVRLQIFTLQPGYAALFEESGVPTQIHAQLPAKQFIAEAGKNDIILLFRPDWSPNGFSSKFFESVALRKPILYTGPEGAVKEFICDNRLGFALTQENMTETAAQLEENLTLGSIPDKNYPLEKHSFQYWTEKLTKEWALVYGLDS